MLRATVCCLALVLVTSPSLRGNDKEELRTLRGKTVTGNLTAISGSEITFQTDAGPVGTLLSQVLVVEFRPAKGLPATSKCTAVRLLDDSMLYCQTVAFKGNEVEMTLFSGASFKVPVNFLVWMLRDGQDAALRKQFDNVLMQKSKRDRILILGGGTLNALEGTLGEVDPKGSSIQFRPEGAGPIDIVFEKLHGLIFYRTEVSSATPLCRAYDVDGNTLNATKVAVAEDQFTLTTSFGAKVGLKRDALAKLDFNIDKLTYLSDMEPTKIIERSGIGLITHYRKDANLDGEPILLEKMHAKGISLHAHTELFYDLAGKYKEFKARLGVDTRTGSDSQALVTIYCDREKRFEETVSTKTPKNIALSVKDVSTLRIVVSSRNFLDLQDHATLADARVSQ